MKHVLTFFLWVMICLVVGSCQDAYQKAAKSKYGDANRIRCTVLATGGVGKTVDDVLAGIGLPFKPGRLASTLNLPGSGILDETLIICEKRWYWGGARGGNKWLKSSSVETLVISTPSSVPSSSEVVIFTTRKEIGKSTEIRNYKVLGTIGDVEVWRYTGEVRRP